MRTKRVLLAIASLPMLAWTADLLAGTAPLIVAAALLPALFYAGAIVGLQRGARRPASWLLLALLWGLVGAASLSSACNALAREWLNLLAAGGDVRAIVAMFVAPIVEEGAKTLGLVLLIVLLPAAIRTPRDGIVYGALIGVGFVAIENVMYLGLAVLHGGEQGLWRAAYLRGVLGGATHAVFTASAGAGIGWARSLRSAAPMPRIHPGGIAGGGSAVPIAAPLLGFSAALLQHFAWNGAAARMLTGVLCDAETPGAACRDVPTNEALFGWATLVAAAFVVPGALLLAGVARAAEPPRGRMTGA